MKVKLIDVCDIQYGYAFDSKCFVDDETCVPLIRIRDVKRGFSETYYSSTYSDEYLVNSGDLLIGMDGEFNIARWKSKPSLLNQRVCKIIAKPGICEEYIRFVLSIKLKEIERRTAFVTVKHLSAKELNKLEIEIPEYEIQLKIANTLQKIEQLVELRKTELISFNSLIKSRFVEMFGDPIINNLRLNTKPMTELCEIIDGDRGKNYPTAEEFYEEGHCLFLNAKNVTPTGFDFGKSMFISEEKDTILRKGKLQRGDVVLTTRGTIGNLAFYTDDVPYDHVRINSGMVILRMNKSEIDERYFIEQFKMQLSDIKEKIASGSAQPQLPISTMNKIEVVVPDIDKQNEFAAFVNHIDKLKVKVQQSLDETQILMDSLMQKYFG